MLILGTISKSIISVGIWVVSGIYHVASWLFGLFIVLASGTLLNSDVYEKVITNFYIVIGIVMLFFLAFTLLKNMVNPDDAKNGTSAAKNIVVNLVTSAVIMALLPTIFTFLFDFQSSVLSQNSIGTFFGFGGSGDNDIKNRVLEVKQNANMITNNVFTAFFNVEPNNCNILEDLKEVSENNIESCQKKIYSDKNKSFGGKDTSFASAIERVNVTGNFAYVYTKFSSSVDDEKISFSFLFSLVAGVLLVYVALSFCIDMALRLVKLVFYQLIAPIPLFMRIIPDTKLSGAFNDWLKITLTCYLEVYVRLMAIYFVLFICSKMLEPNTFLTRDVWQYGFFLGLFAKAFVLMGLIMFARQFPKLLSDVTGLDSGNMKLGIRDKLKDAGVFTAGAAIGGGVTALTRNATNAISNGKFNFRKNYREARESGKGAFRSTISSISSGLHGSASILAGFASGTARSGRAGANAGSFGDMHNAAGSGAKGAVDARDRREAYKARHGDSIFSIPKGEDGKRRLFTVDENGKRHLNVTGTAFGHIEDAFDTGKRWAGINNVEEYQESIASMDNVNSKVDAVADEARKVLASNAKTGKKFDYGLYQLDENGRIVEVEITDPTDPTKKKKVKVLRQDKDVVKQYGVNLNYSLDNYRSLENAIQRAESSGGSVFVRNVNGRLEVVDPDAKNADGTSKYTEAERKSFKSFDVDTLSRMQNLYVTNYSEAVANQAFKSKEHYNQITDNMEDYKEVAAMSAIRAKAEDAKQEMARVLNSEAVARANKASYEHYYKKLVKDYMEEKYNADGSLARAAMTQAEAEEQAKKDLEARKELFLTADTVEGDLKITDRTALNYYGAAVKEVKSEYQTEISKIQQKEKDKNGK